jgi:peptidoglycan/LPS O-acetylase OafA/YrhL
VAIIFINNGNEILIPSNYSEILKAFGGAIIVMIAFLSTISTPVLKRFGDISYEFYLIHFPILLAMRSTGFPIALYVLASFVLSVSLAYVLFGVDKRFVSRIQVLVKQ